MDIGMKRNIVLFTSQMIKKEGIRAVRMDDIAKEMSMSKRTIYQMFNTKQELINVCIDHSIHLVEQKLKIFNQSSQNSMDKLLTFTQFYVWTLHRAQKEFWRDFSLISDYEELYTKYNTFWADTFKTLFTKCKKDGYIVKHINLDSFVNILMNTLYNARLTDYCYYSQRITVYVMIRGMTTIEGSRKLDSLTKFNLNTEIKINILFNLKENSMYLHEIGTNAGSIWTLLSKHQERMTIREIADQVDCNKELLLMAIGWLAKENKISFYEENNVLFVQLRSNISDMYF